jgi:predicted nucleotidyltransferase
MNTIVADKLPQLAELCRKYRVERMYLFGSAARDDFDPETSDIDLLYTLKKGVPPLKRGEYFFELHYALEALFGREIDLVAEHTLKSPYFIASVERSKQLLYVA